ncbi:NAD(P)/FAD-dependent oxidoreductase [bacterium]|nr:NAD(P)/FAD-dependent oxidoreductase [bacterium]
MDTYRAEPLRRAAEDFDYDAVIAGAGAVGLACAAEISFFARVLVVETHERAGCGASSRNSEVLHAGLYYPINSMKAKCCVEGRRMIEHWASDGHIPLRNTGKFVVATEFSELDSLYALHETAQTLGVKTQLLDLREFNRLEPNVRAVAALWSPETSVFDSHALLRLQSARIQANGGDILFNANVEGVDVNRRGWSISVNDGAEQSSISARAFVNCAGLYADSLAEKCGVDVAALKLTQHWSKGNYYRAAGLPSSIVTHLIYPAPPKHAHTLGIHTVLDLQGELKFGPTSEYLKERNEDYSQPKRCPDSVREAVARYLPRANECEFVPDMSGIRAKLQGEQDDFRDFVILSTELGNSDGQIHLLGIDSPGLTASPAIGKHVAEIVKSILN